MLTSLFVKKRKLEIMYRWKIENQFTLWTTYKKYKTKDGLEKEFSSLTQKVNDFIEYKVA